MAESSLVALGKPTLDADIVQAIAWCRLGSSAGYGYPEGDGFQRAKALGLLAQDSVWRATPQGEGVLIALGMLKPTWKADRVYITALWAVEDRDHAVPQFVRAWSEGYADCWTETFADEVEQAKEAWREWPGQPGQTWEFTTTVEEIARPEVTS